MKNLLLAFSLFAFSFSAFSDDQIQPNSIASLISQSPAILVADQADNHIRILQNGKILWAYPHGSSQKFKYRPTDAKRVDIDGESHVLIAYHGRVQLVRLSDHKLVRDYSSYGSCHSAERLPDGALVTASSNHGKLRVHHSSEDYNDLDLPYAHGVTWDKKRKRLWALGDSLYRLQYTDGKLIIDKEFELPDSPTGHDLFPLRIEDKLLVSNNDALYRFDIESGSFETISELRSIKSASQHADGSVWVTDPADIEGAKSWQSNALLKVHPEGSAERIIEENARFYKARWWQKVNFSR